MDGGIRSQVDSVGIAVQAAVITVFVGISKLISQPVVIIRKSPVVVGVPAIWIAVRAKTGEERLEISTAIG